MKLTNLTQICLGLLFLCSSFSPAFSHYSHRFPSYDYVIVGAGAAGSVLANRLSADPRNKVLVLEAGRLSHANLGGEEFSTIIYNVDSQGGYVPGGSLTIYDVPAHQRATWNTGKAPYANDEWNIPSNLPLFQSKIVGGCHAHNGMQWGRAIQANIESWNITGWTWDSVLYYYKKSENVSSTRVSPTDTGDHGFSGPIQISDPAIYDQEGEILRNSCLANGFPAMTDFNSQATPDGCGDVFYNIRHGVRDSSAHAYLAPALARPNLDMRIQSQVVKVLFSQRRGEEPKAIGVQYINLVDGTYHDVFADKEVILSCGTLLTPKVLYFSGIGPKAVLQSFNFPVLVDNQNVGFHIRNVPRLYLTYQSPKSNHPNFQFLGPEVVEYAKTRTGPLAQSPSIPFLAYVRTNKSLPHADVGINNLPAGNYFSELQQIGVLVLSPKYSDGYITLQSADPLVPPYHEQPVLAHQEDVDTFVAGIKLARQFMDTPPASTFFGAETIPGRDVDTDEELEAYVRAPNVTLTVYHFAGSARMGNPGDPLAVVDPRLRVNGVTNLRVVDASVIPGVFREKIQATIIAIAEKGADLILQDNTPTARPTRTPSTQRPTRTPRPTRRPRN